MLLTSEKTELLITLWMSECLCFLNVLRGLNKKGLAFLNRNTLSHFTLQNISHIQTNAFPFASDKQ